MIKADSAFHDEEITKAEGNDQRTAWGRMASIFADLDSRDSQEAATLLLRWTQSGHEQRVLISALARLLSVPAKI